MTVLAIWYQPMQSEWTNLLFLHPCCRQIQTYVKPEAAITVFELLMVSVVSLETCWAIKKQWNNKFYYTVASCWLFLYESMVNILMLLFPSGFETRSHRLGSNSAAAVLIDLLRDWCTNFSLTVCYFDLSTLVSVASLQDEELFGIQKAVICFFWAQKNPFPKRRADSRRSVAVMLCVYVRACVRVWCVVCECVCGVCVCVWCVCLCVCVCVCVNSAGNKDAL
jgi:hypothetical protein